MTSKGAGPKSAPKADHALSEVITNDLKSLRSMMTCKVCFKFLYEPYTLSCGHTFCYSCLCTWFETNRSKKTCPKCRSHIEHQPAPSYLIKEMVSVLVGRAQLMPADETPEEHSTLRAEESAQLERDKANKHETTGGLFRGCFRRKCPALMVIRDPEDGVDRCPLCSWELELGRCERCHLAFDEHGRAQDYTPFYDSADTDIDAYGGFSDEELDDDLDLQDDEMEIGFETYYSAISRGAIVRGAITQGVRGARHAAAPQGDLGGSGGHHDDDSDVESLPTRRPTGNLANAYQVDDDDDYNDDYNDDYQEVEDDGSSLRDFIDYDDIPAAEHDSDPDDEGASDARSATSATSDDDTPQPPRSRGVVGRGASVSSAVTIESDEGGAISNGRRRPRQTGPRGTGTAMSSRVHAEVIRQVMGPATGSPVSVSSGPLEMSSTAGRMTTEEVASETDEEPIISGSAARSRNPVAQSRRKRLRASSSSVTERSTPSPHDRATAASIARAAVYGNASQRGYRTIGEDLAESFDPDEYEDEDEDDDETDEDEVNGRRPRDLDGDVSMRISGGAMSRAHHGLSLSDAIEVDEERSSDASVRPPRRRRQPARPGRVQVEITRPRSRFQPRAGPSNAHRRSPIPSSFFSRGTPLTRANVLRSQSRRWQARHNEESGLGSGAGWWYG